MPDVRQLLLPILFITFLSCHKKPANNYAIKDFRKELQPLLTKTIRKSIGLDEYGVFRYMATDDELVYLSRSEHPLLRVMALVEMLQRSSFDHFSVIMQHLDDTAFVAMDYGEFGIWYGTVSDYMLNEATWKTQEAKNKTIDRVLTRHNYLRSAFTILDQVKPQEKYYLIIKDMATRPRSLDFDGYETGFDDIEYALYALARFRKKEDVKIMEEQFQKHLWSLGDKSFSLMREFPDTAYMDILQEYHRRHFYNYFGNKCIGFSGRSYYGAEREYYLGALAAQQSDESARLLDTILQRLPRMPCLPNNEEIQNELVMQIWQYPVPAYAALREKVRANAEVFREHRKTVYSPKYAEPPDTYGDIRWFR